MSCRCWRVSIRGLIQLDKGQVAAVELLQFIAQQVQIAHAQRLEVIAHHGFHRLLPTGLDREQRRHPRQGALPTAFAKPLQPVGGTRIALTQGGLLQSLKRRQLGVAAFAYGTQLIKSLLGLVLRRAQAVHLRQRLRQAVLHVGGVLAGRLLACAQGLQRCALMLLLQAFTLARKPIDLRLQAQQLAFKLLDAGRLDFAALARGTQLAVELFPAQLPVRPLAIGRTQALGAALLGAAQRLQLRRQRRNLRLQLRHALGIGADLRGHFPQRHAGLRQIGTVTIAQFAGIADVFFGARHFRAQFIAASLHASQIDTQLPMEFALLFQRCLERALLRQFLLHNQITAPRRLILHRRAAVDLAQSQRE